MSPHVFIVYTCVPARALKIREKYGKASNARKSKPSKGDKHELSKGHKRIFGKDKCNFSDHCLKS